MEGFERLGVGHGYVGGAARFLEMAVFGANAGIVEARADAVGFDHLAVGVLEHIGARAVKDAHAAHREGGGMLARFDARPGRFYAYEAHTRILDEGVEDADAIAAAAYTGYHVIGQGFQLIE